jgi:hypothetical protein
MAILDFNQASWPNSPVEAGMRKVPVPGMVVIIQNEHPGRLNNFTKNYYGSPLSNRVQMDQDRQPSTTQQENFKKELLRKYGNHEFGSPDSTFQRCFYGGNYIHI